MDGQPLPERYARDGAGRPLVVDLDGSLLRTDLLYETFWAALGKSPRAALGALRHLGDRSRLKAALAEAAALRTDLLPFNQEVLALTEAAQAEGREVVLASASDERLVARIAREQGFSARCFGSRPGENLKGQAKAAALVEAFGPGGFDYVGNESSDLVIWRAGADAVVVGDPRSAAILEDEGKPVRRLSLPVDQGALLRALRPHQWVKNILLFLPVLAAHDFGLATLVLVLFGMAAFSAAASAIYVVNDLLDLEADRRHVKKWRRPFAAGAVPITHGMAATALLMATALGLGLALGPAFLGVICVYMALSLAYSMTLKRMRWIDIAVLATLYTLRVVAGAAATGVAVSTFMLVFVFPVFFTLGCVKRLTELTLATGNDRLPGRGYGKPDRPDLLNMAGLGTVAALVIFFLYTFTDQAAELYPTRWLLWAALVPIALWMLRMVRLGWHGQQDHDPIVFAMKDKRGLGLLMIALALMFYSAGIWQRMLGL